MERRKYQDVGEWRAAGGKRYRVKRYRGVRNKRNKREFYRYGASAIHLHPGHNAGKPFPR